MNLGCTNRGGCFNFSRIFYNGRFEFSALLLFNPDSPAYTALKEDDFFPIYKM